MNNCEFQKALSNHSSDIEYDDFMIYRKCKKEPYSFLVNDITLPLDHPLLFRKNLNDKFSRRSVFYHKYNFVIADEKINDKNLQCNREAAKISTLPISKTN